MTYSKNAACCCDTYGNMTCQTLHRTLAIKHSFTLLIRYLMAASPFTSFRTLKLCRVCAMHVVLRLVV